jgi:glutamyl-tRNA synthetase
VALSIMACGRFAPSPTGDLHLGNLRTALLAWLAARSTGSAFLMRIDDLDRERSRPEFETTQLRDLAELGIDWEPDVIRQSERFDRYNEVIGQLADAGLTYECFCTRREIREAASAPHGDLPDGAYPGTCRSLTSADRAVRLEEGRPPALRLRTEGEEIAFVDRVHGPIAGRVDDFVLRRNDGGPAYNLAVVIDDTDQRIEQVVRGDDLLSSTPRHIHLARLLSIELPEYAHVPLVLGPDGERLAKRDGPVTLRQYREHAGIDSAEVRCMLAETAGLIGPDETPSVGQLIDRFDFDKLDTAPWTYTTTE